MNNTLLSNYDMNANFMVSDDNEFSELSPGQIEAVSGGLLPLLGALGAVITFAPEIEAAVNGFFEAL